MFLRFGKTREVLDLKCIKGVEIIKLSLQNYNFKSGMDNNFKNQPRLLKKIWTVCRKTWRLLTVSNFPLRATRKCACYKRRSSWFERADVGVWEARKTLPSLTLWNPKLTPLGTFETTMAAPYSKPEQARANLTLKERAVYNLKVRRFPRPSRPCISVNTWKKKWIGRTEEWRLGITYLVK